MITETQFKASAKELGCTVAAIKAVAEVESDGEGFLMTGEPKILFEPHIFWKQLKAHGINPYTLAKDAMTVKGMNSKKIVIPCDNRKDPILYPIWVPGLYGPSSDQHRRLQRAVSYHHYAALESASWGKFQILGMNFNLCNYTNIQSFVNDMYKGGEDAHLKAFVAYIKNTGLDDELRFKKWDAFARAYNGPLYWQNKYDKKLSDAYKKFS